MSIRIESYKSQYLELQAELGKKIWERHSYGFYSSLEQLRDAYSGDDFDPELKLYAFDGEELIGFVTAALTGEKEGKLSADIALPHVRNLDETVTDQLYNAIVEKLQTKGVTYLTARAGNGRRNTLELVEKYGFTHLNDQVHLTWVSPDDFDLEQFPILDGITDFDFNKDLETVVQFFSEQFDMDKDQARNNFKNINKMDQDMLLSHIIVRENERIVGRGFMQQLSQKDKLNRIARLSPIIAVGTNEEHTDIIRKGIFRYMVETCKRLDMVHINMSFVGVPLDKTEPYTFLEKEFYTLAIYQKSL